MEADSQMFDFLYLFRLILNFEAKNKYSFNTA